MNSNRYIQTGTPEILPQETLMISLALDNKNLAKTYDAISDSQFESGKKLLAGLNVKPGETVLDIGCGTGRLGRYVIDLIGPTGRFIGIDPLADRISIANESNQQINAEFLTGVAEDLSFLESNSVDLVYLSAVFHWVPDKQKALQEINRVLKPGGRIGLTTNAKELVNATTLRSVTTEVLSKAPFQGHLDADSFAPTLHGVTTTQLVELFLDAGFRVSDVRVLSVNRLYKSGREIIDFVESSTFGNYLNHVPEALRDKARSDLENGFEKLREEEGIPVHLYTLFAIAEKIGA
jgi:ubiquinone/menaquinone biosynthesis C-methylase UbiE